MSFGPGHVVKGLDCAYIGVKCLGWQSCEQPIWFARGLCKAENWEDVFLLACDVPGVQAFLKTLPLGDKWQAFTDRLCEAENGAEGISWSEIASDFIDAKPCGEDFPYELLLKPWPEVACYFLQSEQVLKYARMVPGGEPAVKLTTNILSSKVVRRCLTGIAAGGIVVAVVTRYWPK
jgi:hypothetical protein